MNFTGGTALNPGKPFYEFVTVAETYNQADIALIKSLLDQTDIVYYLKDEYINIARPFLEPVKVMVAKDRAEHARELLSGFELTFFIGKIE